MKHAMKFISLTVIYYAHFCFLAQEKNTMKKDKRNEPKPKYPEKKKKQTLKATKLFTLLCNVTKTPQQRTYEY
jgi:hypothetical protein